MYRVEGAKKREPHLRWSLSDRVFFACGACHILAYAFLERHGGAGRVALWIKPDPGFTGNHIVVSSDNWVFDYHGHSCRDRFLVHIWRKAGRWWPGWQASLLPRDVRVSEALSRTHAGLWLQEPS